jgi:hypothetical protein
MRLPFRNNKPDGFKGIRARSMLVPSAEVATPRLRGSSLTSDELSERLKRIKELRRANGLP